MPTTRYFLLKNCSTPPVVLDGKIYAFERVMFFEPTSSWWGVLATTNRTEIKQLAGVPRVKEISEADYNHYLERRKSYPKLTIERAMADPLKPAPKVPLAELKAKPEPVGISLEDVLAARRV